MGFAINVLAGLTLTVAYAPFGYFFGAIAVVLVTAWSWRRYPLLHAFGYGYLFGLVHFGSSIYWVYHSLHDFGNADPLFAAMATFLLVAVFALYFALLAWIAAWCASGVSTQVFYWFIFPSLWMMCEYLRSTLFGGFPWNLIGQSLIDSPFWGVFAWVGTFGASWLVAFLGGCVATVLVHKKIKLRTYSGCMFLLALLIGWSTGLIQWTEAVGEKVSVGIVQSGVAQGIKFDRDAFTKILKIHQDLTSELFDRDLVVWSETAIPAYYHQVDEQVLLPLHDQIAAVNGGDLLTGIFFRDEVAQKQYNSLVKVGIPPETYHKRHLVPFGEYIPLRFLFEFFRSYVTMPMSDLDAGNQYNLLTIGEHQVGMSICYEAIFGREVIESLPAAAYLVNVSNDSWFGDSIAVDQHLQMARLRAAETGRPMIRATSTGVSAMINHQGRVIRHSERFSAQILTGDIQPRQGTTLYARYGDRLIFAFIIALLLFVFSYRYLSRKRNPINE